MRFLGKRLAILVVLAGAALLVSPPSAHAAFTLTLHETGFADQVFTPNAGPGAIVIATTIGHFTFQADIATSNSPGSVSPAVLSLSQTSITTTGGGTLTITVNDTGFTAPGTGLATVTTQLSTTSLTAGGSVSILSRVNGTQVGPTLTLGTAAAGTMGSGNINIGTPPFTLTNVTTVTLTAGGMLQSTGNTTVAPVPEPATLFMAFAAVPIFGLGYWRQRRRKLA
jgi:hypothetical protein